MVLQEGGKQSVPLASVQSPGNSDRECEMVTTGIL